MATTPAKLAACRANAARSTGPRTEGGRAIARMNALKHGLRSDTLAIGEDGEAFAELVEAVHNELLPRTALEATLANQVIAAAWRLRRAAELEACALDQQTANPLWVDHLPRLDTISKYRRAAERSLTWALGELTRLRGPTIGAGQVLMRERRTVERTAIGLIAPA